MPAANKMLWQSFLVRFRSIKTGSTLSRSVSTKRLWRGRSSAVKPNTCQSTRLVASQFWRARFFNSIVQGAPVGPLINFRCAHTSTAEDVGYFVLDTVSIGCPSQRSTSFRKRMLSASSSITGLFSTRTAYVDPYISRVFLAATALATPHENQTAMVCIITVQI